MIGFHSVRRELEMKAQSEPVRDPRYLSPIYTAAKFWHGSDEKSTRTKKIVSAQIDFVE